MIILLQIELTLYDPKNSSTSSLVTCDQDFCTSTYDGPLPGCRPELLCQYNVVYGDGSSTAGYFVKDNILLQRVTGNLQAAPANGSVVFGWVVFLILCFNDIIIENFGYHMSLSNTISVACIPIAVLELYMAMHLLIPYN